MCGRNLLSHKIREIGRGTVLYDIFCSKQIYILLGRYGTVDIMKEPMSGLHMAVRYVDYRRVV